MISKGKILFYGLFRRSKNAAPTKVKKLSFLNKLMLLQVRRFENYKDIPKTLSLYDWMESKQRAQKHYGILGSCILLYLAADLGSYMKYRQLKDAENLYEERRRNNLPDYPLYNVFGENPEFDKYHIDFIYENREAIVKRKPDEPN